MAPFNGRIKMGAMDGVTVLTALGLETTCDETAAAIVRMEADGTGRILADVVADQIGRHAAYGGVVPEIAARAHVERIDALVDLAFEEAGMERDAVDLVAASAGPGLLGGVAVGLTAAKALALALETPLVGVNHLEAHALTVRLTHGAPFPYLLFLASGGHCQLVSVLGVGRHRRLGATLDDALGEAFDKTAKLMGLPYPGGPAIERRAEQGRDDRFALPRPLIGRPGADFSFAGLKTAVRDALAGLDRIDEVDVADMAASFQKAACDVAVDRASNAMALHARLTEGDGAVLVAAGGVAANRMLRARLEALCAEHDWRFIAPPAKLCTDNAAMVAWTGLERMRLNVTDDLDLAPRARWPLDPDAAPAASAAGWGAKGPKA